MRKTLLTLIAAVGSLFTQAQWISQNVPMTYDGYMFDMETSDLIRAGAHCGMV